MVTALGYLGLGAAGLSSIFSAKGEAQSSEATAEQLRYQAGIAEARKRIALQNRDFAYEHGESEAIRFGMKARAQAGSIKAAQGASGVDVGSGSSVDVQKSQRMITELDTRTILDNAARVAYGYESQSEIEAEQGRMYSTAARRTEEAAPLKVATSLLSGVTSVSSKWLQGNQMGLWNSKSEGWGA